ncbi:unnamed protein product, partial [Mesorhabditis belari]|uniref:Glycosyltransferase family 92 protein n=1 Tax=Mesorhabditis belari TaxID=2138241 RepID=A0AAF3EI08_9BILA
MYRIVGSNNLSEKISPKSLLIFIGAGAIVLFLLFEVRDGVSDDRYEFVVEEGETRVSKEFIFSEKKPLSSLHLDDILGPYDVEQYKLDDGTLTGDEIFVWYAFYDRRRTTDTDIGEYTLAWVEVLGSAGCTGGVGGHCRLQETDLSTVVYRGEIPDEISIIRKGKKVKVKLHVMPTEYKDEINSCIIAPLFWYNDWPRLFVFFEWWKRNKIHKILLHIHSISAPTKKVIDYYVKQGLVEVRPFPLMPFTKQYNPNNHAYYSSEHMTTFFCSIWSNTQYTTMNDVDELFHVVNRSETLLDVARRQMGSNSNSGVGAVGLPHHALGFPGGIAPEPWDFEKFQQMAFVKETHPFAEARSGKYIYKTKYAKLPGIHGMRLFYAKKYFEMLPKEQAVYLHMRNEFTNISKPRIFPDFKLFEDQALLEMSQILNEIFSDGPPSFKFPETRVKVDDCIQRALVEIRDQDCIKPTGTTCYAALKDLDEWLYAKPIEDSRFLYV